MKEFLASILIALGIVQPALPCEPPTVCTDGLIEQERIEMLYSEEEVIACAKLIYGEYGADWVSDDEKAKVVCTLVNRTHSGRWISYVGSSELMAQLTAPDQFTTSRPSPAPTALQDSLRCAVESLANSAGLRGCALGVRYAELLGQWTSKSFLLR